MAIFTSMPVLRVVAATVGGFGRGANGSSAPFAPVELTRLSQPLAACARGGIYSADMAIGFTGMGPGALPDGLPVVLAGILAGGP